MLLGKSCSSKFHVSNSGTLRIGTLYEYRHIESPQIVDREEGVFHTELSIIGPVSIERRWFNIIGSGAVFSGGEAPYVRNGTFRAHIAQLGIAEISGKNIIINSYHARIERESDNGFIFCMSQCEKKSEVEDIFPDYDSYWFIEFDDCLRFGAAIADALKKKIFESHLAGSYVVDPSIDIDDFNVIVRAEPVFYIDRHISISAQSDISVEELLFRMGDMNYIKPRSFSKEREFRFHFMVVSKGKEYFPIVKSLIIEADSIFQFLM